MKLEGIQKQMDYNDDLINQLRELQKEYEKLGTTGAAGWYAVEEQIKNVQSEQSNLGGAAGILSEQIKQTKKYQGEMNALSDAVGNFGSVFSNIGSGFEVPELDVAGTIAQSIATLIRGAMEAQAMSTEYGGPFAWLSFGAMAMAQVAAIAAQIHSISGYASGGIIRGNSRVGDKNLARVNAGEMIINDV